jgi:protease-4
MASEARAQDGTQEMAGYYEQTRFLEAPSSAFREGLLGFANPAASHFSDGQAVVAWTTPYGGRRAVEDWGVFTGGQGLGLSLVRLRQDAQLLRGPAPGGDVLTSTGASVSLATGSESVGLGAGYQWWYGDDATALGRFNRLTVGGIVRPASFLSIGATGYFSVENDAREYVGTVGLRPLGSSRVTLFGDVAWDGGSGSDSWSYSAGATVEVIRGVDLVGRIFENGAYTAGLRAELGRIGLGTRAQVDRPPSRTGQSGGADAQVSRIRIGSDVGSAIGDALSAGSERVELAPKSVPYRTSQLSLFSDAGPRFYDLLRTLRRAARSDRVAVVALDLSALDVSREKAWELRREIENAQTAGTTVVAFVERAGMNTYHLASAADYVALDPKGSLLLPGYASSNTFFAQTLDRLGLGVQVFRYFEYKSAFEALSRNAFSEADSLQRQQLVDDRYRLFRQDIAQGRGLAPDSVDRIVNERVSLDAVEARQAGLVDTLARWHERDAILQSVAGRSTRTLSVDRLNDLATASRQWGARPEIALVYGIGTTSLDSGIEARTLAETFRDLADDDRVEAVVFRVDSPGGSTLASDLVAQAVKACAAEKPVIVSQGTVAASGGYDISVFADRIVAGPNTVTGSIGVIGLWIYDDGLLSDKAGFGYDVVQRGDDADLYAPYSAPLIGGLPARKLDEDALARRRQLIQRSYDDFVEKVAAGRDTTVSYVRSVAEGRVYSGSAALDRGLVDEIGGLHRAIAAARRAAGLADRRVRIREVNPSTGFLNLPGLLPVGLGRLLGVDARSADAPEEPARLSSEHFVRTVLEQQPAPLMLLPPGYYAE